MTTLSEELREFCEKTERLCHVVLDSIEGETVPMSVKNKVAELAEQAANFSTLGSPRGTEEKDRGLVMIDVEDLSRALT